MGKINTGVLQNQVTDLIKLVENYSKQIENFEGISRIQTQLIERLMKRITRVENTVYDIKPGESIKVN